MQIPHNMINRETLLNILKEIVTRDGTDYGAVEISTDEKVAQVMSQLERGDLAIVFDRATETVNLAPRG